MLQKTLRILVESFTSMKQSQQCSWVYNPYFIPVTHLLKKRSEENLIHKYLKMKLSKEMKDNEKIEI